MRPGTFCGSVTTGPPRRDYGDLPDRPYPTLLASNGARHTIQPGFHLGAAIDADVNGQPDPAARRDDENGIPDDEDGVFFLTAPTPGAPQRVRVDASARDCWMPSWTLLGTAISTIR